MRRGGLALGAGASSTAGGVPCWLRRFERGRGAGADVDRASVPSRAVGPA